MRVFSLANHKNPHLGVNVFGLIDKCQANCIIYCRKRGRYNEQEY